MAREPLTGEELKAIFEEVLPLAEILAFAEDLGVVQRQRKLDIAAPLLTSRSSEARYQVGLVRAAGATPRKFCFAEAAFDVDGDRMTPGEVAIDVDPVDPRRIRLTVVGRPDFFGPLLHALSARVVDVADPAGNTMSQAIADKQVVTGAI